MLAYVSVPSLLTGQIAHLDHTELDLELRDSHTGQLLGRPWATFLVDAFSRRLLAVSLTFDPPSYRAAMLILRECVQRHARLPQILVVDGGQEFHSIYFETLLARYEVTKKTRPWAKPRFGAVLERLFATTNSEFIHTLTGNTHLAAQARHLTPAVDPQRLACWTLPQLTRRLQEWAYEVYDTNPHATLGTTPREAFQVGLLQTGTRPQRLIAYDETFRLLTLPSTPKGTATVQPNRGLKLFGRYFWAEALRDPAVEGTAVPVRYDPADAGQAYAFVGGQWVGCISEYYTAFQGHSEREIALASAELRRRAHQQGQRFFATAVKLAAFLTSAAADEPLQIQRARDAETAAARPPPGGPPATTPLTAPTPPPPIPLAPTSPDLCEEY